MKLFQKKMFWIVAGLISGLLLLLDFPLILFTLGPIGAMGAYLYAVLLAVLIIATFRKPEPRSEVMKRVLLIALMIPGILFIVLLLIFNSAWFHFPG